MPTEGLGPRWFGAMNSVLLTVVASARSRVVTMASPLPRIAIGTSVGVEGVACITAAAEALLHRNRDVRPAVVRRLVH